MDRIKRRAEAFQRFSKTGRLPDMVAALKGHWAGKHNLDPFFVWSGEGVTFADHIGELVAYLDGPAGEPGFADLLLLVTLETIDGWGWEAGPRLLADILAIMRVADDRATGDHDREREGRDHARGLWPVAIDENARSRPVRTLPQLFDVLCDRTAAPLPDLTDPTTAALYGNACAMLFHSRKAWHDYDAAPGRKLLAGAAATLLAQNWDFPAIKESCRAAIMPWAAWRIFDNDHRLTHAALNGLWSRVSGDAPLPEEPSRRGYLRYSLATAYHETKARFRNLQRLHGDDDDAPPPRSVLTPPPIDRSALEREIDRCDRAAAVGGRM